MSDVLGPASAGPPSLLDTLVSDRERGRVIPPTEPPAPAEEPAAPGTGPAKLEVRATVHLPKLPAGRTALVDPTVPYIAGCLARGTLVPVERHSADPHG